MLGMAVSMQLYSIMVIVYRVATFNDCTDAAAELKRVGYGLCYYYNTYNVICQGWLKIFLPIFTSLDGSF